MTFSSTRIKFYPVQKSRRNFHPVVKQGPKTSMLSDEDGYIPWNPEESRAGEALYISNVFIPFGIQHPSQAVARVSFDSTSSPSRDYAAAASTLQRNLGPSFDNAATASTLRNLGPSFDDSAAASLRNLREPQESQQLLGVCEFVSYLRLSLP